MKKLLVSLMLLAGVANLTGCAGMMMDRAKTDCTSIGYQPGTPAYVQCVDTKYTQNQQNFQKAFSAPAGGSNYGSYPGYGAPAAYVPQNTQCRQSGAFINCTTF